MTKQLQDAAVYDHAATIDAMVLAFRQFGIVAQCISDAEIEQARRAVSMAESLGFVVDPTRYRDALFSGSLVRQRQVVDLFASTAKKLGEIFPDFAGAEREKGGA